MTTINDQTLSYYARYRRAAIRFEMIGSCFMLVGIVLHLLYSTSLSAVSLIFAGPGAFLLIIGGASLRPHNLIKAFAQQCSRDPSLESAQGLLEALCSVKQVRLVNQSIQTVQMAVEIYAASSQADLKLVKQLQDAINAHIVKKVF